MRTLFLLLLSCLPCLAQFGVEQPMFQLTSTASIPLTMIVRYDVWNAVTNGADASPPAGADQVKSWGTNTGSTQNWPLQNLSGGGDRPSYSLTGGPTNGPCIVFTSSANTGFTNLNVNVSTSFLACAIFRFDKSQANYGYLVDGISSRGLMINHDNNNGTNIALAAVTCGVNSGAKSITKSVWYLGSFWVGYTNSLIRTNGVLCGAPSTANTCFTIPITGMVMGRSTDPGYGWDGAIAAFRLYSYTNMVCPTNAIRSIEQEMGSGYGITIP